MAFNGFQKLYSVLMCKDLHKLKEALIHSSFLHSIIFLLRATGIPGTCPDYKNRGIRHTVLLLKAFRQVADKYRRKFSEIQCHSCYAVSS